MFYHIFPRFCRNLTIFLGFFSNRSMFFSQSCQHRTNFPFSLLRTDKDLFGRHWTNFPSSLLRTDKDLLYTSCVRTQFAHFCSLWFQLWSHFPQILLKSDTFSHFFLRSDQVFPSHFLRLHTLFCPFFSRLDVSHSIFLDRTTISHSHQFAVFFLFEWSELFQWGHPVCSISIKTNLEIQLFCDLDMPNFRQNWCWDLLFSEIRMSPMSTPTVSEIHFFLKSGFAPRLPQHIWAAGVYLSAGSLAGSAQKIRENLRFHRGLLSEWALAHCELHAASSCWSLRLPRARD